MPDLGISAPSVVARMLAWAVDGTDFRPSRSGGGSMRAAAHGLRGCRRAMAQWRGQVAGPQDFGPLGRCTHIGVGVRHDRFSTIDKRGRRCLREPAHGLGEWPRAMARPGRLVAGPQDFGPLGRCTHIGVGVRRDRFSTIDKRGRRCLREPAHGLREWPRAMARRGGLVAGPQDFGPLGRCTHIGVGARRDRFSTIDKRRCDCAGGCAQAASVSVSDVAPA